MKFLIEKNAPPPASSLIYSEEEYSFNTESHSDDGITSIMINDLQLEIDDSGKIIYVWGVCPLINYGETNEAPKNFKPNCLIAILNNPPIPGISYRLNENERWPIYINKMKGWVCVGNPKVYGDKSVEFVSDCVAVLDKQEIIAIWLKPKSLPI